MEVLMDRAWAGIDAGKEVHWAYLLDTSGWKKLSRMMSGGNKNLKRVFYQVAFASLRSSPESRAFYNRKRTEGKRHIQALIALARRRVKVVWAMLRDGTTFEATSAA
jgi:hypothetical protein